MVAFKTWEVLSGLFGLGFTSMILSYLVQRYEDIVLPVLASMGASQLSFQIFDAVNYTSEWLLPIGLLCMLLAAVLWAANWGN